MNKVKRAVVTGATSGVGKDIAAYLLKSGWKVSLIGRDIDSLEKDPVIDSYEKQGKAIYCKTDLSVDSELDQAVSEIEKVNDKLDILVHSAAFYTTGLFEKSNVSDLDDSYRVNVRAPYLLTQKLLPKLTNGKGVVVFLNSSTVTGSGHEKLTAYVSSKSALKSIAESLRKEVNLKGVRVMNVFLGKTDTPMQEKASEDLQYPYKPSRMMKSEHVAKCICDTALIPKDMECTDLYLRPSKPY
jgi:short-subunit dehydrogenase